MTIDIMEKEETTTNSDDDQTKQTNNVAAAITDDLPFPPMDDYGPPLPPDGGWGWMVVVASFFCNLIVDGVCYTFGIFFDDLVDYFDSSKGQTALVGSMLPGMYLIAGPFVSALANKFGCQRVTICGSILASLFFIISIYSNSISLMILTYGVMGGIGFGLIYLPSIVMVGFYFDRKRALATGIAVCGSGIGTFVFAPFGSYLVETYTWKGANVILAGLILNGIVCALIFRPLEARPVRTCDESKIIRSIVEEKKRLRTISTGSLDGTVITKDNHLIKEQIAMVGATVEAIPEEEDGEEEEQEEEEELRRNEEREGGKAVEGDDGKEEDVKVSNPDIKSSNQDVKTSNPDVKSSIHHDEKLSNHDVKSSNVDVKSPNVDVKSPNIDVKSSNVDVKSSNVDVKSSNVNIGGSTAWESSMASLPRQKQLDKIRYADRTPSLRSVSRRVYTSNNSVQRSIRTIEEEEKRKKEISSPFVRQDIFYAGSVTSIAEYKSSPDMATYIQSVTSFPVRDDDVPSYSNEGTCCSKASRLFFDMFDFSLLRSSTFVVVCLAGVLAFVGLYTPFVYITKKAMEFEDVTVSKASLILSIIGICNTFGRLIAGWLADRTWADSLVIHNVSVILAGVLTCLVPALNSYEMLCVYGAFFGVCIAAFIALRSIVMVELLGIQRLTNAFGLSSLFQGIAVLIGSPLSGAISEATGGSLTAPFIVSGCMFVLGGVVCLPARHLARWENKKTEERIVQA